MKGRQVAYYDKYGAFYILSIGCHILNIVNKKKKILMWHGQARDVRLHIFLVAPSGFGKSFFLGHFIEEESGILYSTVIHCGFEQATTGAGWTGTIKNTEDKGEVIVRGLAQIYQYGIIGIEEFSAIVAAMSSSHSKELDSSLLTSLDTGRVRKKLAAETPLCYMTCVSLWSGTQVARFDITSGMGRRLCFMCFFPTEQDKVLLKLSRRRGCNISYDPVRLEKIRDILIKKTKQLEELKSITFDKSFYHLLDKYNLLHYEEVMFENIALGYYIMKYPIGEHIVISADPELERLLNFEFKWRAQLKRGGQTSQILGIIEEHGGKMKIHDLMTVLTDFQLDYAQSSALIQELIKTKVIQFIAKENSVAYQGDK